MRDNALIIVGQAPVFVIGEHLCFIFLQLRIDLFAMLGNIRFYLLHLVIVGVEDMALNPGVQLIERSLHLLDQRNTGHRIVRHIAQVSIASPKAVDTEPAEENKRQHNQQRYELKPTSNVHNRTLQMKTI